MHIRHYAETDFHAVVALWKSAGVWRPWNDPARDLAFACESSNATVLLGLDDDTVVTTAMAGEDGHRGWVYYVAVHPEHHGNGHGRQIMDAAEAWLRERGIWKVQALVRADNQAAGSFYERLGYVDTRTRCYQKKLEPEETS